MSLSTRKLNTNGRIVSEILTNYRDTFRAFAQLVNNSIQAEATEIHLNIVYGTSLDPLSPVVKTMEIIDNGNGVALSDFDKKIFEVGTTIKPGGHGIGRFSALQIGETMQIETVGYDHTIKKFTKVSTTITASALKNQTLTEIDFPTDEEVLDDEAKPYYKVTITKLHHNSGNTVPRNHKLTESFLKKNLPNSLAQFYINEIFNGIIKFHINGELIDRDQFVIDQPIVIDKEFTSNKGTAHQVQFQLYNIASSLDKVKIFTVIDNAGMKAVANEYTYSSDYYTPELGTWFIYIETDLFTTDLFRNALLETFGDEELQNLKSFIRDTLNEFFKERNKSFGDFLTKLSNDAANPFIQKKPVSETHELVFNKIAYLVESEYKILDKGDKIRILVYELIDSSIRNGNVEGLFTRLIKMKEKTMDKFHSLMETTEIESVIHFSSQVAEKIEFINFLHDITYGEVSKILRERSQLHKIIEKQLWLFGENYTGTPFLWSDRRIGGIFTEIRTGVMDYELTEADENLIVSDNADFNDITDLFFYNEKMVGDNEKEYMIVELKAPKCNLSQKELAQIDRYAYQIESAAGLPTERTKYKLILISSDVTAFAKSKLKSARERFEKPFLYDKKTERDIEVYVMTWAELIEMNKRRLNYLSSALNVKDKDVKVKFEEEYPHLITDKINSQLRLITGTAG